MKKKKLWTYDGFNVIAHTKSEARAILKRAVGAKRRLPVGAKVERVK